MSVNNSINSKQALDPTASPTFANLTVPGTITAGSFSGSNAVDIATGSSLVANTNYITSNGGSLSTLTLPATAAKGSVIQIMCYGSGGMKIAQLSGQSIVFLDVTSTVGATGSIATFAGNSVFSSVKLICTTANTGFQMENCSGLWNIL